VEGLTERERLVLAVYLAWLRGRPDPRGADPPGGRWRPEPTLEAGRLLEWKAWVAARAAAARAADARAWRRLWTAEHARRLAAALAGIEAGRPGAGRGR
jgi:hypothetical protein